MPLTLCPRCLQAMELCRAGCAKLDEVMRASIKESWKRRMMSNVEAETLVLMGVGALVG